MAVYRVRAELRRDCSADPWTLGGFVFADAWHPWAVGVEPPTGTQLAGCNVETVELPAFLAPDDATAVVIARREAVRAGYVRLARSGPPVGTYRIAMPSIPGLDED